MLSTLFYPIHEQSTVASLQDQIQLALAIADELPLKALVTHCIPAITAHHLIGKISVEVGVPTHHKQAADGILHVEMLQCILANSEEAAELELAVKDRRSCSSKSHRKQVQCESGVQTLEPNISWLQAELLLSDAEFSTKQIEEILHLPAEAWHRSWWYMLDENLNFSVPFLRFIRPIRYPDGTLTLQYKDYFEQDKPRCFRSYQAKILVKVKPETQKFGKALEQINYHREALGIDQAVLICNTISELEAQGFIRQGISIYPAVELVLPMQADCLACARKECAMNGQENSLIATCYGFVLEGTRI